VLTELQGRTDTEVAEEAWEGHLKRHQSVIVDLFQGQLKSKVQCPDCDKVSTTFDPFMFLSLPLTEESKRTMEVTLVKIGDRKNPVRYCVQVETNGSIKDLKRAVIFAADVAEGM
jgi:ubiquitin carboxyl-terminal hydrolase 4/11/15